MYLLLTCEDTFLLKCYLNSMLLNKFNTTQTLEETKNDLTYQHNIHFNIYQCTSISTNFASFVQYISNMFKHKSLFNKKKTIILNDIHHLTKQQQHILTSLIDKQHSYNILCTTSDISKVSNVLKSRFFCKSIDANHKNEILHSLAKYDNIDTHILQDCIKLDKKLYASVLYMYYQIHSSIIEDELSQLMISLKRKQKHITTFILKIRDVMYKILSFNIPHSNVCRTILTLLAKKFKKHPILPKIISNVAKLEHTLLKSSKPIYHYEYFFLHIYSILNCAA